MKLVDATVLPCFWLNGNINQALETYQEAFASCEVHSRVVLPNSDKTAVALFSVHSTPVQLLDGGPHYTPHHGLSLLVKFTDTGELTHAFTRLSAHGTVMMELDSYPHSELYAWVEDEFGVSWQLMLDHDTDTGAGSLVPNLMFGGFNQDKAALAIDHYVSTFSKNPATSSSETTVKVTYPDAPDRVMFAQVKLGNSSISAMDSAVEQNLEHSPGSSLVVLCNDQQEIDHFWEALCADEAHAQCGWCVDAFGINWQVVPRTMSELLSTPESQAKLQTMKKIDIEHLK